MGMIIIAASIFRFCKVPGLLNLKAREVGFHSAFDDLLLLVDSVGKINVSNSNFINGSPLNWTWKSMNILPIAGGFPPVDF
jgi:hypothetical protein